MVDIVWTREAEDWLKDIHGYITQDNSAAALKMVLKIQERARTLSRFPDIGHLYREDTAGSIRVLLYGHYRIAYLRAPDSVHILGVFHGAMDIDGYFR